MMYKFEFASHKAILATCVTVLMRKLTWVVGIAVSHRSGGRLAMTLAVTISIIILFLPHPPFLLIYFFKEGVL